MPIRAESELSQRCQSEWQVKQRDNHHVGGMHLIWAAMGMEKNWNLCKGVKVFFIQT